MIEFGRPVDEPSSIVLNFFMPFKMVLGGGEPERTPLQ